MRPFLLIVPRPDLSISGCEVQELRFRAHDGTRLSGLMGWCPIFHNEQPAHVRLVSSREVPSIDVDRVQEGYTEFILQEIPGRRLEDRVLDVLRFYDLATSFESIDSSRVQLTVEDAARPPDEMLIAEELRAGGLFS